MLKAFLPVALLGVCFSITRCDAATISIFDGSYNVGTLTASVDSFGDENATFTLFPLFRSLMSDVSSRQFRYFQVIYYDDEPVTWNGSLITSPGAPAHSGTVVDVPSGGWDYELPGGDDNSPFYESDTANDPLTGRPYAFPTLSYPYTHSADSAPVGTSSTEDAPGLNNANDQTLFETFLVYYNPTVQSHVFDLLGGYSWGIRTDSLANQSGIDATGIGFQSITPAMTGELQSALDRSGYSG